MSRHPASTPRRLLWSRWLVLALLSLTLPLQGALAATMGIGMALMASTSASAVMTMPSDCQEMGHDMGAIDMAAMDHGMDPGAIAAGHGSVPGASPDALPDASLHAMHGASQGDGDHASDHHCGICLQCCLGAALPIAPLTLAARDLRDAAPALGTVGAPEQSPQPLERPPKPFLA